MSDQQTFLNGKVTLFCGNCLTVLETLEENSVDSVVCDPPYHLTSIVKRFGAEGAAEAKPGATGAFQRASSGFMGKQWDGGDIAFQSATWAKVLRVLKPGGYLLAFASTRGFGRMSVAIEDAGFITHPLIAWVFGSGFPKATRIRAEGYDGFRYGGQALKPAIEPVYMGQKPFSEANGTANILLHGTGAINVDGCRIQGAGEIKPRGSSKLDTNMNEGWARPWMEDREKVQRTHDEAIERGNRLGRWPANLIHDGSDEVIAAFPDALGQQQDIDINAPSNKTGLVYGKMNRHGEKSADRRYSDDGSTNFAALPGMRRNDTGSAARFFYSSKADAEDRIGSKHPTVKPIDLMQYLCRLVTPPGGTVLDPFAGTGTTGEAAWREGFKSILIESELEYQEDIAARMRFCLSGAGEKRREIAKRKGVVSNHGPLFEGGAT